MRKLLMAMAIGVATFVGFNATTATEAQACWFNCAPANTSDRDTAADLENLVAQSNRVIGMPSIVNFFEKRMARMIYEMRDDPQYRTYAYWTTMNGDYVFICNSVGYGMNASVQFANPEKQAVNVGGTGGRYGTIPQAEPNGLFMPEGLAATYVLCLDPDTADTENPELRPVYAEQNIFVSPFEIPNARNPYE